MPCSKQGKETNLARKQKAEFKVAGGKAGNISSLRRSLKRKGGDWIRTVPADDSIVVRFLSDPEEWIVYQEYWDQDAKTYVPVLEGEDPDARVSTRYLASVVMVDEDRAVPLKMSKDLANRVFVRYDKYGTLLDRDYELIRTGSGLDTEYDVEADAPSKFNLKKFDEIDLMSYLEREWQQAHGEDDDDDDEDESPRRRQASKPKPKPKRSRRRVEEDDDDEEDEDEIIDDDDDDDDDEPVDPTGDFPTTDVDYESLKIKELREFAREQGIDTKGVKKDELLDLLDEHFGVFDWDDDEDWDEDDDTEDDIDDDDDDFDADDDDEDWDDDDDDDVDDYDEDELSEYTISELRDLAKDFGIKTAKKRKSQLIEEILEAQ